ncbi:MAG: hypothetical protein ACU0CO_11660 [Shimia sp.]
MDDNWIIDVMGDLRAFARANGLPRLAEHLDDAILVGIAETASKARGAPLRVMRADGTTARTVYRDPGSGDDAR